MTRRLGLRTVTVGARAFLLAAALTSAGVPAASAAQAPPAAAGIAAIDPVRLTGLADFVDGVMAEQIAAREVAGAVVTVVHDGRILFSRGYGYADVEARRRVDPERTLFRPGSVSKLFTWVALMQQVERGRVDLDADVNTYLDFTIPPLDGRPIRVRDLMQHTPGMSDASGIITREADAPRDYREWLKTHIPARLWPAGGEISYSNYGVTLAGYIVERVSSEPFADYVETHLFAPLGMRASTFREPLTGALAENMARGYELVDGRFVAQPFEHIGAVMPAGSSSATAPDMARFMLALLGGGQLGSARILEPASVALLTRNSIANTPSLPGMAHGFYVIQEAGPRVVGHGGNTGDFHSNLVIAPEHGFGFFVSTTGGRGSGTGRTDLTNAILGRLFPQAPAPRWTASGDAPQPVMGAYRANRRDYSRPPRPEYDLRISMPDPNRLLIENMEGKTAWERIGPMRFEQVTGAREGGPYNRLEFFGTADDPRLAFSFEPYQSYRLVRP
ncbi:serine hydrolase domain-containing protein [Sphingosinicella terrae]|uniref:serine hydrolase domain-containing protein n=1 Tax=Sphingosinicella terrae TaxID=2172047 RepID=UPI0013B4061B|nr:serine hydrolase domain-containing protein [Sphingosinicella terrae]